MSCEQRNLEELSRRKLEHLMRFHLREYTALTNTADSGSRQTDAIIAAATRVQALSLCHWARFGQYRWDQINDRFKRQGVGNLDPYE